MIPRGRHRYIYRAAWKRAAAAALDLLGGWAIRLSLPERLEPRRILAIRLDHIGDVLFFRPGLQALRRLYPQARITALVSSASAELLKNEPGLDEVCSWDAPWFDRSREPKSQVNFRGLAAQLRSRQFDLGLEFRGDLRHILLLALARVRVRVGYGLTGGGFLLHRCLRLRMGAHEVERDFDVIRALGGAWFPRAYPPLALAPEEIKGGQAMWQGKARRVVIHPAAGDPAKCWPADRFAEVCRRLGPDCQIILVGTRKERALAESVITLSGRPARNAAGETTVRGLAALITAADVFLGNDSGPAHLALTQGIPTVMLWSETNAADEWGPWGDTRSAVIRHPLRPEAVDEAVDAVQQFARPV